MLRIDKRSNAGSAKSYYAQPEYFRGEELAPAEWAGQGAKLLGLPLQERYRSAEDERKAERLTRILENKPQALRAVDAAWLDSFQKTEPTKGADFTKQFNRLCDNRHPKTNKKLTARDRADRPTGWDFSYHPPKSVSVAYELAGDERILGAFQRAVRKSVAKAEELAAVRTRVDGKSRDLVTGVATAAIFWHGLSRPVKGDFPAPHLHAHAFVLNHTHHDGRFLALQQGKMHKAAPEIERQFHHHLRQEMRAIGYDTRRKGKSWELCGVPDSAIRKFCDRTNFIEGLAEKLGVTGKKKARLGSQHREPKQQHDRTQLVTAWFGRLTDKEVGCFQRLTKSTMQEKPKHRWLDRALEILQRVHVAERDQVQR